MLNIVTRLARLMAILGGLVLTALVVLTCVSVLGRGLNTLGHSDLMEGLAPGLAAWLIGTGVGPVTGDYELVEAGIAFAVFAFLPICQLAAAHATVDVFTNLLPGRTNRWLTAFWEVVLALVIVVIGWRLYLGFVEKIDNGQTTFLLQFPIWWAYGASFAASVVAGLVGVYCGVARVLEVATGRAWLPGSGGAEH
ncbi:TRAP transporter small permease [Roseicyclus persicicus]|uniref:TRAP transporter small permease protein n=1 Tax=Roseicyclus persicicus TaxID=2650661 RepID=A0A7X6JYD7_9RHOB|nr:TRAP transporter small permease subunit [Roseibacterium persicicum]NKX45705.1 TRAP transporter small permease [Roseibacterium persicicum]